LLFDVLLDEAMADEIRVQSVAEEYQRLRQHPCACGGAWDLVEQRAFPQADGAIVDVLKVVCTACGKAEAFRFHLAAEPRDLYQDPGADEPIAEFPLYAAAADDAEVTRAIVGYQRRAERGRLLSNVFGVIVLMLAISCFVIRVLAGTGIWR
jgi:hypothetical protein